MKPVKPVVWALLGVFSVYLAIAAASAYEEGSNIFVWMGRFSEVLKRPSLLRWTPHTVKSIVVVLLLCAFAVLLYRSDREKRRPGGEYGTAKWETAEVMNQKYADKDGPNVILTQHVSIGMDGYKHQRNLNVLVVGGSGSGKTRYFCKPGLMDANCSYLVVDPKGEMLRSTGHFLKSQGYDIKVFDLIHPRQSDGYNPFRYIREEPDVLKLMDNLVKNTTPPKGASNDPFWEKAEIALDSALRAKYKVEHEAELKQFYAARRKLTGEFPDGKVDMKKLTEEYDELEQAHETTYGEFKAVRDDLHRLWKVKSCVDTAARFNERTEEQKLQNRPQTRQKKEELSR